MSVVVSGSGALSLRTNPIVKFLSFLLTEWYLQLPPLSPRGGSTSFICCCLILKEYKRRSRDIETETEEELLVLEDASSLSSSVSLSDKSVSTDNHVEEYCHHSDMPFAGKSKIQQSFQLFFSYLMCVCEPTGPN